MTSPSGTRDLLTGSYDCVDRIVLNAYYPLGTQPGRVPDLVAALIGGSEPRRMRCWTTRT